ncbi:undecaprenyl-diphosphatase [Actinopolyspora lacussalsi]|uniref:Undecaprenyl-diphosphatase n=1 Tax=Actinopolyspora righensis TaxID=995060 RepID=A0A1I6Z039_9ACTN|nr:phosphatase PAP2 family protein [Actinopolyspora righensis]MDP9644285.1 undecaprenyl-diphosphatase [Actinopolyspora lacussalsi]SFT56095.1 undecaprenyl-diphosphatase [Actinopolyspora righensis]
MHETGPTDELTTLPTNRAVSGIEDVPDVSANWYLHIIEFANSTPDFVHLLAILFTDGSLFVMAAVLAWGMWRARGLPARAMAFVLLAPFGMIAAYLTNDTIKGFFEVGRPCRLLSDINTIAVCDPPGDWSFPSNHSAVAGATAVAIVFAWRRLGVPALLVGISTAASRVFVGAHFPHDVVVGFLVGASVVLLVMLLGVHPATRAVEKLRETPGMGKLLAKGDRSEHRTVDSSPEPLTQPIETQPVDPPTQPVELPTQPIAFQRTAESRTAGQRPTERRQESYSNSTR